MSSSESQSSPGRLHHETECDVLYRSQNPEMRALLGRLEKLAEINTPILICGETGTGKTLFALRVHTASRRSKAVFKHFYCTELSHDSVMLKSELFGHVAGSFTGATRDRQGLFRSAQGGTLFMDEVGDLPLDIQGRLLGFLDRKTVSPLGSEAEFPVDVRLVFATNKNLTKLVDDGKFREDLLYRVSTHVLYIPPLRERRDDILPLASFFLSELNDLWKKRRVFSNAAERLLTANDWPGNVRDLKRVIESVFWKSEDDELNITPQDMALDQRRNLGSGFSRRAERELLLPSRPEIPVPHEGFHLDKFLIELRLNMYREALSMAKGNYSEAGRLLGTSGQAVKSFINKHGMKQD